MMRPLFVAVSLLLVSKASASAQSSLGVLTKVGVSQVALAGVLENPPVTGTRIKGSSITGTTTARVRANGPWALRVSLVAPVNPALEARFRLGRAREVALSARQPSADVTSAVTPCANCLVTLEWQFVYATTGKTKITPTVPKLVFEAIPAGNR
jgi:hypothetical protein